MLYGTLRSFGEWESFYRTYKSLIWAASDPINDTDKNLNSIAKKELNTAP